jgi:hypothetical protein
VSAPVRETLPSLRIELASCQTRPAISWQLLSTVQSIVRFTRELGTTELRTAEVCIPRNYKRLIKFPDLKPHQLELCRAPRVAEAPKESLEALLTLFAFKAQRRGAWRVWRRLKIALFADMVTAIKLERMRWVGSRHYQKKKVVGLERGPLSLVSTTEELLDRKVAAPV